MAKPGKYGQLPMRGMTPDIDVRGWKPSRVLGNKSSIVGASEGVMVDGEGGGAVEITASRTSGVAPLGVFFEAAITGSGAAYPFHDLLYEWDFGAGETGTWGYGNTLNTDKRYATGPVAAHVFSEDFVAGSDTVTLNVYKRVGGVTTLVGTDSVVITTTSLATGFDVTDSVVYYSDTGSRGTGSFSAGSVYDVERTNASSITREQIAADAADGVKAWLFYGGVSFDFDIPGVGGFDFSDGGNNTGPWMFGSYGTGQATMTSANAGSSGIFQPGGGSDDTRVINLNFDDANSTHIRATSPSIGFLILNCTFGDSNTNGHIEMSTPQFVSKADIMREVFIHGCTFDSSSFSTCLRNAARQSSVQGCSLSMANATNTTGHLYRMHFSERMVVSHNDFVGASIASGATFIKTNGLNLVGEDPWPSFEHTMGNVVISDNVAEELHGTVFNVGTSESGGEEDYGDFLIERNFFRGTTSQIAAILNMTVITNGDTTVRNNVGYLPSTATLGQAAKLMFIDDNFDPGTPVVRAYNNTFVHQRSPTAASPMFSISAGVAGAGIHLTNNIYVRDEATATPPMYDTGDESPATDDNNTTSATSPFVGATPALITDFRLKLSSAAENAGVEVTGLIEDYELVRVTGSGSTVNQGAFENHP